jgi:hypothetical protein
MIRKLALVASVEQMKDRKGMKSSTTSTLTNELPIGGDPHR